MTVQIEETFEGSANPQYPDIVGASNFAVLLEKVKEAAEIVTDDNADIFLVEVNAAFSRLDLTRDNRIEILSAIQDVAHSSNNLYDKAIEQACALVDEIENAEKSPIAVSGHGYVLV